MDGYFGILEKVKERIVEYSQWGGKFVENLSKDLRMEYPGTQGYSVRNLNYMKQFAPYTVRGYFEPGWCKISWKAIKLLIDKTDNLEEHLWYTQQCIENGWSSTVLVHQYISILREGGIVETRRNKPGNQNSLA